MHCTSASISTAPAEPRTDVLRTPRQVLIREGPELYHKVASWFFDLEDEDHPDSMSLSTRPIESVENRVSCPDDRPMVASAADRRLV
jgi:hypothetical protein